MSSDYYPPATSRPGGDEPPPPTKKAWGKPRPSTPMAPGQAPAPRAAGDPLAQGIESLLGGLEGGSVADRGAYGLADPGDWQRNPGMFPLSRAITRMPNQLRYPGEGPAEPYYAGSAQTLLRSMPAEERARLQDLLVATGLASSVIPGEVDPGTVSGFERVLGMANIEGTRWQDILMRLQRAVDSGDIPGEVDPGYVSLDYLAPDPAEIRGSIRDLASKLVPDVELSDDEVEYLRSQFESMGRQEWDEAEELRRGEYDAQVAAAETGQDQSATAAPSPADAAGATAARFREFFEQRYAPNIERREGQEEELQGREIGRANLGALMAFATGRTGV